MQDEDETQRPTDTGMLGSDAELPGPGRDTRPTDPDPAAGNTEHPTRVVGMSGADPQRTRLGSQETAGRPLAGAPASTSDADTGMVGSEAENPGPGRDTRQTDPDRPTSNPERRPASAVGMSEDDPERTRLGVQDIDRP